jgi:hypothetical protein
MPSLADVLTERLAKLERLFAKSAGSFEVATVTPDFTVYLDGSTTAVPAKKVVGLTYIVGTTGDYTLKQGRQPVCTPTE